MEPHEIPEVADDEPQRTARPGPQHDEQMAVERAYTERTVADWKYVLADPHGRRCLHNILIACQVDSPLLPAQFKDERSQQVAIGARSVGLWIRQQVEGMDPQALLVMKAEHATPPDLRHQRRGPE